MSYVGVAGNTITQLNRLPVVPAAVPRGDQQPVPPRLPQPRSGTKRQGEGCHCRIIAPTGSYHIIRLGGFLQRISYVMMARIHHERYVRVDPVRILLHESVAPGYTLLSLIKLVYFKKLLNKKLFSRNLQV
eukprot:sb/3475020/